MGIGVATGPEPPRLQTDDSETDLVAAQTAARFWADCISREREVYD